MANEKNLKRGRAGAASHLPKGDPTKANEQLAANREQEKSLASAKDPDDVTMALFKEASIAALRGYRKFNRRGGEPPRLVIEASKEARQLAEVCRDIIRARGATTEAERFFAQVAGRISEANLGESPRPVGTGERR